MNRPLESWSTSATCFATSKGLCIGSTTTARAQGDAPGVRGEKGKDREGLPVAFAPVRRMHPPRNEDVSRLHLRRQHHVRAEPQRVQFERLGALGHLEKGVRGGVLATHDQGAAVFHRGPLRAETGGESGRAGTIARNARALTRWRAARDRDPSGQSEGCDVPGPGGLRSPGCRRREAGRSAGCRHAYPYPRRMAAAVLEDGLLQVHMCSTGFRGPGSRPSDRFRPKPGW